MLWEACAEVLLLLLLLLLLEGVASVPALTQRELLPAPTGCSATVLV
jgi:hypothetical protein